MVTVSDSQGRTAVVITGGDAQGERGWAHPRQPGWETVRVDLDGMSIQKIPSDFRTMLPSEVLSWRPE